MHKLHTEAPDRSSPHTDPVCVIQGAMEIGWHTATLEPNTASEHCLERFRAEPLHFLAKGASER